MDILKPILDIYDEKKNVLLFYMESAVKDTVFDLYYLDDDDNQLFLNDKVYIINRSALELDNIGTVQSIKDDMVCIKVKSKYSVHFNVKEYHIFIKRKKNKKNDMEFYKALLNTFVNT